MGTACGDSMWGQPPSAVPPSEARRCPTHRCRARASAQASYQGMPSGIPQVLKVHNSVCLQAYRKRASFVSGYAFRHTVSAQLRIRVCLQTHRKRASFVSGYAFRHTVSAALQSRLQALRFENRFFPRPQNSLDIPRGLLQDVPQDQASRPSLKTTSLFCPASKCCLGGWEKDCRSTSCTWIAQLKEVRTTRM